MGRDPVGQPASRSMGFSKWAVLIGRTGFVYTISSLPDPTLMFLNCHSEVSESRVGKTKKTEKTSRDKTIEGCHRRDAATAPCLSVKRAFPRRQLRSSRRSHHYYSLTHYAQTAHNGAMAAPTEHLVCLILFAKYTVLKTKAGVPSLRCRDSGPYFFPKRTLRTRSNRQPMSPMPARFARTRAPRVSWWTVYYCNTTP